ncbi:hypothetical protein EVAR_27897_1 [Eumeta japonica]|uniref:Uncharacterized protein n=1 Tax=Eumeta variegata TaxID=151549 RepID=A0A4C1UV27_EUMVA|nr:hypothetical protein EVAR_27897_1 [Eumeta japonica]
MDEDCGRRAAGGGGGRRAAGGRQAAGGGRPLTVSIGCRRVSSGIGGRGKRIRNLLNLSLRMSHNGDLTLVDHPRSGLPPVWDIKARKEALENRLSTGTRRL